MCFTWSNLLLQQLSGTFFLSLFLPKKPGTEQLSNSPKVTQLVNGGERDLGLVPYDSRNHSLASLCFLLHDAMENPLD